jgi:hypothetical protein
MPCRSRDVPRRAVPRCGEDGSAVIEFLVVGLCVLVPMVYIVLSVMTVHAAAFASTQAVREAGRAFSTAATPAQGRARALIAARIAFQDQGLHLPAGALRLDCEDGPCLAPGSAVEVRLDWRVPLPWLPGDWSARVPTAVPILALQRVPVDDYRGSPSDSS